MRREIRLRTNILAMMLMLALTLAAALIGYSWLASRRASLAAAEGIMQEAGEKILGRLRVLLVPPISVVEVSTALGEVRAPPGPAGHPAEPYFSEVLRRFPAFRSIFVGFSDGAFVQVYHVTPEREALRAVLGAPPGTDRAIRLTAAGGTDPPVERWRFYDADGRLLEQRRSERPPVDPRQRPWFKAAMAASGTIRTPPAPFPTGEIGVTVARAFRVPRPGAVGIDVTVAQLAAFLHEQRLADDGLIAVFRATGEVTVSSAPAGAGTAATPAEGDLQSALLAVARAGRLDQAVMVEVGGESQIARVMRLPFTFGDDHFLGIVVPARHFTAPMDAIGRRTLLVSLLIVALFVPLMLLASRTIARPLQALTEEVDRIREFRLEGALAVRSRVIEINRLARSVATLKAVLRSFGRYVPKDLVRQLVQAGPEPDLGGERRDLTVLFTDLVGFTDYTERTEPETVMQTLSAHFAAVTEALAAEDATIDKFIGDSVMALWNAPKALGDHTGAACRAALAARERQEALNALWREQGIAPMTTRFGIHCGEAIVGHVGSRERLNYTAVGTVVNLAARLEGLNRHLGTTILVSGAVEERVRGRFLMRSAGLVRPKGFRHPVRVVELLGPADASRAAEVALWEEGWRAFLAGDWAVAERRFTAVLDATPDDALAARYLDLVRRQAALPPDPDWAGVEIFVDK